MSEIAVPSPLRDIGELAAGLSIARQTAYSAHSRRRRDLIPPPSLYVGRLPRWRDVDIDTWIESRVELQRPQLGLCPPETTQQPRKRGRPRK